MIEWLVYHVRLLSGYTLMYELKTTSTCQYMLCPPLVPQRTVCHSLCFSSPRRKFRRDYSAACDGDFFPSAFYFRHVRVFSFALLSWSAPTDPAADRAPNPPTEFCRYSAMCGMPLRKCNNPKKAKDVWGSRREACKKSSHVIGVQIYFNQIIIKNINQF